MPSTRGRLRQALGTFEVFNVADASISVGTAVLILAVWISERKQQKEAQENQEQVSQPHEPSESEQHQIE